jgi:phospholipid/cholesterol/gamma-HCH transport system ATP-binding protein
MIRISGVTVSFESGAVLDNIDLDIEDGTIAVILGKNGCGKSVLLKSVVGLIAPSSGSITINVENESPGRARAGYVFQRGGLFDSMTVFDNVAFGLRRAGVPEGEIESIIGPVLKKIGLGGSELKIPSELSGGMQKRVGFARAICLSPSLILYDDPTAGLDPVLSDAIADIILEIRGTTGCTSIVATHDLKVAEKIADTVVLLYDKKIVFNGTQESFFSGESEYARQFISGDIEGPIAVY